jgi:uncharacterized protein (DUF1330 family)
MNDKKFLLTVAAAVMLAAAVMFAAAGFTSLRAATVASKGYVIAEITVTDPEAYKQYAASVSPIAAKFGGKYLVRGGQTVAEEGDPPSGRIVVIEFDSLAAARSFEDSKDYQAVAPLRRKAAHSRVFLVEGVAQ